MRAVPTLTLDERVYYGWVPKAYATGEMLGKAHNPSMRIVQDGLVCLRVALLALFGALVLAGSASAAALTPSGESVKRASDAVPSPGEEVVTETPTAPAGEAEGVKEATEGPAPGPGAEQPPSEEAPAESGPTGPGAEEAPAEPPPAEPPAEEAPAEAAPAGPGSEEPVEAAPTGPVATETPEPVLPAPGAEETREAAPVASAPPVSDTPVAQQGAVVHASETTGEASNAPIAALTMTPTAGVRAEEQPPSAPVGVASVGEPAGLTAMQMTGDFSCELSALGGRMTDNCTAGWLGTQRFLSLSSPMGFASAAVALAVAVTAVAPARGAHGDSAVGSTPVSPPAPGPAPGGSSGSATGSASGFALSTFLTLSSHLSMGAPRAMRRLRLSCQPWRTACFVLIPERPG